MNKMLDSLLLEHKSYLIGMFQGDGSLSSQSRGRGKLVLELSLRDKDIIFKIEKLLAPLVKVGVSTRTRDTNFKKNYKSISLSIYKKEFRDEIENYVPIGVKSDVIKAPTDLQKEAYIRGLTDADGSIGITALNKPFWSLTTSSENIKSFILKDIEEKTGSVKRINRNKRDDIYNITLFNEDAVIYTSTLYNNSSLHLDRKFKSFLTVQKWIRTSKKRSGKSKAWLPWEDKIVLSNEFSIEEQMGILKRSKASIKTRSWRLKKLVTK